MERITDVQNSALSPMCATAKCEFLVWSAKLIPASRENAKGTSKGRMSAVLLLQP